MSKTPPSLPSALERIPSPGTTVDLSTTVQRAVPLFADAAVLPPEVEQAVREDVAASRAKSTVKAYEADTRHFRQWCASHGLVANPALSVTVAGYASMLAKEGLKYATIARRLASIGKWHALSGIKSTPDKSAEVRMVLGGIARRRGRTPQRKEPLVESDLLRIVAVMDSSLDGLRDRALLLVGYAGAFRSSELVALTMNDLEFLSEGVLITVRRSKTDQEGQGHVKSLLKRDDALCPVGALGRWLNAARISDGPVFRPVTRWSTVRARGLNAESVTERVKFYAKRAGLDPQRVASHSLRAGHVTQRLDDGDEALAIMDMTGHTSQDMLKRYDRRKMKDPFSTAMGAKKRPVK